MKEKLNCVKTGFSLFILHSSFSHRLGFSPSYLTFDCAKGYVSSPETWSFTRRKVSFRTLKPKLSQIWILYTVRLQFKIHVTICQTTLYEKRQKTTFFQPSDPFIRAEALNLGPKFEYYLTKVCSAGFVILVYRARVLVMPNNRRKW